MNVLSDIFGTAISFMVEEAIKDINKGDWGILLTAYNNYQHEERDCADYIYDSNNNEDMIDLLKSNFSLTDIANATNDEYPFIKLNWIPAKKEYELVSLDGAMMMNALKTEMRTLMEYVITYAPYNSKYMEVYKKYVSNKIEEI